MSGIKCSELFTQAASGERIAKQCEENVVSEMKWGTREL
jgi:hypothetical protein